jgi:hypothetical protein
VIAKNLCLPKRYHHQSGVPLKEQLRRDGEDPDEGPDGLPQKEQFLLPEGEG